MYIILIIFKATCIELTKLLLFLQLGITTMTPSGLLQGAKSIVGHNKQLRNKLRALEREIKAIRDQNNFMVSNTAM